MRDAVFGEEFIELWADILTSIICTQGFDSPTHFILSNHLEFHEFVEYLVFGTEEVDKFLSRMIINEHGEVFHTSDQQWEGTNNIRMDQIQQFWGRGPWARWEWKSVSLSLSTHITKGLVPT